MTAHTVTLNQLESHLWEAANILRGPVDAADFKTYVFPLLFFKRLSDVHDEEYQTALEESGGDEEYARFPQNYRFQVPEGCHWRDIRAVTINVGQALQTALRGVEKANPETLYGIFGDAQWTNKDRLSDALLRDLIEHFSRIVLGNQVAQADILGQSYEYLIKKFADATNKKAGEFYTPRSVVRLMVNMLDPREGESIYDPACGTGGMLLEAVHHVKENHGDDRTLWAKLFGQEKNLITSAIARMNLLRAVVGRGPNLCYGTGLAACILVFRQRKMPDRKNKVLILDGSKEFKTGRAQNELLPERVERIHGWYRAYQGVEGVARVVTLEEIAANDYNLNIPRYVEPKVDQQG